MRMTTRNLVVKIDSGSHWTSRFVYTNYTQMAAKWPTMNANSKQNERFWSDTVSFVCFCFFTLHFVLLGNVNSQVNNNLPSWLFCCDVPCGYFFSLVFLSIFLCSCNNRPLVYSMDYVSSYRRDFLLTFVFVTNAVAQTLPRYHASYDCQAGNSLACS